MKDYTSIEDLLLATLDAVSRFRVGQRDAVSEYGDLVDHALVWVQLRSTRRSVSLIPWRYRVLEHLAHRVPVQSVYPRSLSSAHPFYKASPANSQVHLHLVHPIHLQSGSVVPN